MPIREILRIGHPLLRRRASAVPLEALGEVRLQELIDDLIDTMHAAHGAGLAATQVGEAWRIAVVEVSRNPRYPELGEVPLTILVNPVVTVLAPTPVVHFFEGCLSVPGLRGRVTRPGNIRVQALDRFGTPTTQDYLGPVASVLQHELDHLDGVLFVDRADPTSLCALPEFEQFVPQSARIVVEELPPAP